MSWFFTIVIGAVVLGIIGAVVSAMDNSGKRKFLTAGRDDAEVFIGDDGSYLMLDFDRHTIGLGSRTGMGEAKFSDIMTVELLENGTVLTQTNRSSQAIGATVGSLAFGGAGFLVGGLTGSTLSQNNIDSIVLRVHVASRQLPSQDVLVLSPAGKKGHERNGILAKDGIEKANRLHSLVLQAMRLADEGAAPKISTPPIRAIPAQDNAVDIVPSFAQNTSAIEADESHPSNATSMSADELRRRIDALKQRTSKSV